MRAVHTTLLLCFAALLCVTTPAHANPFNLTHGSVIITEGDSLTYGQDESEEGQATQINGAGQTRSPSPYPETLSSLLNGCADVINHGFPGDRSVDGLVRWQASNPAALTILMYGSNDALNYGRANTGTVDVKTFRDVLGLLIKRRQQQGSQILVLSPPPIGGPKNEKEIEPYRIAAKKVAKQMGVMFLDTSNITKEVRNVWLEDKVHFTTVTNQFLAREIAKLISCHE